MKIKVLLRALVKHLWARVLPVTPGGCHGGSRRGRLCAATSTWGPGTAGWLQAEQGGSKHEMKGTKHCSGGMRRQSGPGVSRFVKGLTGAFIERRQFNCLLCVTYCVDGFTDVILLLCRSAAF